MIDPLGSSEVPLHRYAYKYGTAGDPISTTMVEALVDRDAAGYHVSYQYSDRLGRTRLTKTEAEEPYGWTASGWQGLSRPGKPTHVYESSSSASAAFAGPQAGTEVTVNYHDAMDRETEVYPPQTVSRQTYTKSVYLPFETRVYDERDSWEQTWSYRAVTKVDEQGRTIEILKHNDVGGTLNGMTWQVRYDPVGNILGIVDPKGNARRYTYDTLARTTQVEDPNAGTLTYTHDSVRM